MRSLLSLTFICAAITLLAQSPSTFTGTEHLPTIVQEKAQYGMVVTAAEEGGFFISPGVTSGSMRHAGTFSSDTIYFVFPSDSTGLTAHQKFGPGFIKIPPPVTETNGRFGSLITEMGDYLLIADTVPKWDQATQTTSWPVIYLYEEIHDQQGNRWEYTGKSHVLEGNWQMHDMEKISATEVAIGGTDTVFICDFDPNQTNFFNVKQPLTMNTTNYWNFNFSIEAFDDRLVIGSAEGIQSTGQIIGYLNLFERPNPTSNYTLRYDVSRNLADDWGMGRLSEHISAGGEDFILTNHHYRVGVTFELREILFKVGPTGFEAVDSTDRLGLLTRNHNGSSWNEMDGNQGVYYVNYSGDRSYASVNISIGTTRMFRIKPTSGGGYELDWYGTILPKAGTIGDTSRLDGAVAIGNHLETSGASNTWGYGWVSGHKRKSTVVGGNTLINTGSWYTSWDAYTAPSIGTPEYSRLIESKAYPNPASDRVTLEFSEELQENEVYIMNTMGQIVRTLNVSGSTFTLNRDGLPSGTYFIQVRSGDVLSNTTVVFE